MLEDSQRKNQAMLGLSKQRSQSCKHQKIREIALVEQNRVKQHAGKASISST